MGLANLSHLNSDEVSALEELSSRLTRRLGNEIRQIILFGSKARGDFRSESDIDVLVIALRRDWDFRQEIYDVVLDISLEMGVLLSVKVMSLEEFDRFHSLESPFVLNVQREGVPIWIAPGS